MPFLLALVHYCIVFTFGLKEHGLWVKEGFYITPSCFTAYRRGDTVPDSRWQYTILETLLRIPSRPPRLCVVCEVTSVHVSVLHSQIR